MAGVEQNTIPLAGGAPRHADVEADVRADALVRNTVAGFWKLRQPLRTAHPAVENQLPALRRFAPDAFLFGRCSPEWDGTPPADGPLPFDADEVFENYLYERYAPARPRSFDAYYRVRPLIPLRLRRGLQRWQARRRDVGRFPRWPVEPSLVRFHQLVLAATLEEGTAHPHVAFWPDGRRFAFVLTHDVDSAAGFARIETIAAIERDLGLRSAWFVVPELYRVDWDRLRRLADDGFEIGIHGLRHDGRLFSSRATFEARLPAINGHVRRSGAAGFRSPATLRRADWLQEIGVDYDASYFDTDPFEPQPGGTCSWFPFFLGRLLELPYTLPQDFTLFEKLGLDAARVWTEKMALIERHGGMALMLTHPDYLDRPERLQAYAAALQWAVKRANFWHALPRDVARWWRARDAARWREDGTIEACGVWANELRSGSVRVERGVPSW